MVMMMMASELWYFMTTCLRYELRRGRLEIKDVKWEDAGRYRCRAKNEFGESSRSFSLNVLQSGERQTFQISKQEIRGAVKHHSQVPRRPTQLAPSTLGLGATAGGGRVQTRVG